MRGLVMSSALWGTALGALAGVWPTDPPDRKPRLYWGDVLFFVFAKIVRDLGINE